MASFSTLWLDEPMFAWLASWASIVGTGISLIAAWLAGGARGAARAARREVERAHLIRLVNTEFVPELKRICRSIDSAIAAVYSPRDTGTTYQEALSALGAALAQLRAQNVEGLRRPEAAWAAADRAGVKVRSGELKELKNALDEAIAMLVTLDTRS